MEDIRDTRPWFWILIAALAVVAIVALVIAISANNESVNQKKVVNEATAQIKDELAGLNGAIEAAEEFQEESDQLAQEDQKRIKRQVNQAVAGGEAGTDEAEEAGLLAGNGNRRRAGGRAKNCARASPASTPARKSLEAETEELDKRVTTARKAGRIGRAPGVYALAS